MKNEDRILLLLTRRLCKEASPAELEELDHLVRLTPGMELTVSLLSAWWKMPSVIEEEHNHREQIWLRIKQKMTGCDRLN